MEKKPKIEKRELFKRVDLKVKEPNSLDSTWGISYRTVNNKQNRAYNRAADEVCKEHNLGAFHQVSGDFDPSGTYVGSGGSHQWDFWRIPHDIDPREAHRMIEGLFQEIHTRAEEIFNGSRATNPIVNKI